MPRTDIKVTCEGVGNLSKEMIETLKSFGINQEIYLSLNFTNNANFAGEDFSIILNKIKYDYLTTFYGLGFASDFLCRPIDNKYKLAYFKCDYIPPKSSIELRLLPLFDSFDIIYWSKTTPEKHDVIKCNNITQIFYFKHFN